MTNTIGLCQKTWQHMQTRILIHFIADKDIKTRENWPLTSYWIKYIKQLSLLCKQNESSKSKLPDGGYEKRGGGADIW